MESTTHTLQGDIMAASLVQLMEEGWGGYTMQQADRGRRPSENPARTEDRGLIIMSASSNQLFFQILLLLISCRHINTKTPGPTPVPMVASSLTKVEKSVLLEGENHTEVIELSKHTSLQLECKWTGNGKKENLTGYWTKDGNEIENSHVTVQMENEQYKLTRVFSILNETQLGKYSCVFGNEAKIEFTVTVPQFGEIRDKPIIGYVRDYVVIECKKQEGKPTPNSWNWFRENGTEKKLISHAEIHRYEIKIKDDGNKTRLVVRNLTKADSGLYVCGAVYAIGTAYIHTKLKIITLWEPLKPFIAILVEVIVLVAAILLYELSRSRKKHAAENGPNPDQTNTMMQEENNEHEGGSSVRQRRV